MPDNIFILPERPSFTNDNRTDSDYYAWFHWDMNSSKDRKDSGRIKLTNTTPISTRRPSAAKAKKSKVADDQSVA